MRIEKTMWRMLRSIVSSRNRIKRRERSGSAEEEAYVGKVYATVKSLTSNPTLRDYGFTEETVVVRTPLTITSVFSESVHKTATVTDESQVKKGSNAITSLNSERVRFSTGAHSEESVVAKTVLNILFISSEEV